MLNSLARGGLNELIDSFTKIVAKVKGIIQQNRRERGKTVKEGSRILSRQNSNFMWNYHKIQRFHC